MNFDIKIASAVLAVVLSISGLVYKGITKVQQVNENTSSIVELSEDVRLNRLKRLHRQALSDYYYWKTECKKNQSVASCRSRDDSFKRVQNLEKQIEDIERKRR